MNGTHNDPIVRLGGEVLARRVDAEIMAHHPTLQDDLNAGVDPETARLYHEFDSTPAIQWRRTLRFHCATCQERFDRMDMLVAHAYAAHYRHPVMPPGKDMP